MKIVRNDDGTVTLTFDRTKGDTMLLLSGLRAQYQLTQHDNIKDALVVLAEDRGYHAQIIPIAKTAH